MKENMEKNSGAVLMWGFVLANEWWASSGDKQTSRPFSIIRDCVKRQRNAYWERSVEMSLISSWNETLQTMSHSARDSLSPFQGHRNIFVPGIWLGHLLSVCGQGICWLPCTLKGKSKVSDHVLEFERLHYPEISNMTSINGNKRWPIALGGKPARVLVITCRIKDLSHCKVTQWCLSVDL